MIRMTVLVLYAYVRGTASDGNVFAAHFSATLLALSRCLINFVFHNRVKTLCSTGSTSLRYCAGGSFVTGTPMLPAAAAPQVVHSVFVATATVSNSTSLISRAIYHHYCALRQCVQIPAGTVIFVSHAPVCRRRHGAGARLLAAAHDLLLHELQRK